MPERSGIRAFPMNWLLGGPFAVVLFGACAVAASAAVQVPAIFSDHLVLQRGAKTPVWGSADPGEHVSVVLGKITAETVASAQGKWKVLLDLSNAAQGPQMLAVEGKTRLEIQDVLVGEVWLCSGQSNMAFRLKEGREIQADVENSEGLPIRYFLVQGPASPAPREACPGKWIVAGPETTPEFSAVAFFFARKLAAQLNSPVGLISASVGGTPIEAWTSAEAIATMPDLKASADALFRKWQEDGPKARDTFQLAMTQWQGKYGRADVSTGKVEDFLNEDTANWTDIQLLGNTRDAGLPAGGSVWLRTTVNVPIEPAPGSYWAVDVATPSGLHAVFVNGKKVGDVGDFGQVVSFAGGMRRYTLPLGLLHSGKNSIAVRVFHPGDELGIQGNPSRLDVEWQQAGDASKVSLIGKWKAKMEKALPPLTDVMKKDYPPAPEKPPGASSVASTLFNGLINPIIPYGIRGAIWYQGEANAGRAYQYQKSFPLMIRDWRTKWGQGDFPFYFCQLANFQGKVSDPKDSAWAELREAQSMALKLPNTGEAVLIDIGEAGNIHPRNKKDAGERLALAALANTYGKQVAFSGPVYKQMSVEGDQIRLQFSHVDGGLVAGQLPVEYLKRSSPWETAPLRRNSPDSPLEGFAICGEDRQWVWANARIDGDAVLVRSEKVAHPIAVRYAWADNPNANLTNASGLPASPFRTDDFPGLTAASKY